MNQNLLSLIQNEPDKESLENWLNENVNTESPGFGNGHEWFAITGIAPDKLPVIIRTLQKAEEISPSYQTFVSYGQDKNLVLQCHTAKDFDHRLLNMIIEDAGFDESLPVYWQEQWDSPDYIELNPDNCEITFLRIEPYDLDNGYNDWNVEFLIRDIKSGEEFDLSGGCINAGQADSMWFLAKSIPKANTYQEMIDDIDHLYDYDFQQE